MATSLLGGLPSLSLHLISTLLFAILLAAVIIALYRLTLHPLASLPGPLLAKVTPHWRNYHYFSGTWHEDILRLHRTYGPVVRIAPNEVSLVDAHATKTLYGPGTKAVKTSWYTVWEIPNTAPQLFNEQDRATHGFLRRRLASAYSMSSILKYEMYIQRVLDLLLQKLGGYAQQEDKNVVDMAEWTNAFAFDVVGELGYGEQLGHLREEQDVGGLRKAILDGFTIFAVLGHMPGQAWIVHHPVAGWVARVLGMPNAFGGFREWSEAKIKKRMEQAEAGAGDDTGTREDLLSHFCRMKTADGGKVSFQEVLLEAMSLIGAGADTTSIGMRACLYYVSLHPDIKTRLQKEVDDAYVGQSEPITYLQTQQLPLLQAVVKEATRLHPSIAFQLPRHAPEGFHVLGYKIPTGTPVGISPTAQNRDPDVFGPDAEEFRPDRWLEDAERAKSMDTALMTFGGNGPRMCIGRNIALVELHKFLAQLIHHFDFELADQEHPWKITTHWFANQHDMRMRLRLRPEYPITEV